MKALIRRHPKDGEDAGTQSPSVRNPGETVRESDGILGIDWSTGAPLTNAAWCGGPYTLIEDYHEPEVLDVDEVIPICEAPSMTKEEVIERINDAPVILAEEPKEKVYVINGREITESELKNLLIAE